jgi:hypothetical protein
MLITDQNQIAEAISQIIGEESYVSLRRTDFDQLCPHPSRALHVTAPTPALLLERLEHELAAVGGVEPSPARAGAPSQAALGAPSGVVAYLRCANLRMSDLERIDALLPHSPHFKRGLSFVPEDAENEVWTFVEEGR